ncbi:aromatic ring-hydroxylating dioxygenase subunit alpha [Gammaproteobacteria bacterium]|nr:aromatic ring-hydroxylating dioxygenase subunit alpha [Gammaproteobacteria bacterium]
MSTVSGWDKVKGPVETAYTLPPSCYFSPDVYASERKRIFSGGWVSFGRAEDLGNAGEYFASTVADTPLVAVRGDDGEIRVFANTCRHRGMQLLSEGRGCVRQIACPFHGWGYALDGALTATPRMKSSIDFDKSDFGLIQISSAVQEGFIFVNLDGAAGSVDDWLSGFSDLHQPWNLEALRTASQREFKVQCNWKLFLEVFNEYYHLKKVHPGTFGSLYRDPDPPEPVTGCFVSQFGEHVKKGSVGVLAKDHNELPLLPGLTGRLSNGTRYSWVYPNLSFAASRDALWMLEVTPIGPTETQVRMRLMFDADVMQLKGFAATLATYEERMQIGMAEDIVVLEAQQIGVSSQFAQQGRFCPELEPSVHAFQEWYAERMSAVS